jgi:hypothetical protein
MTVHPRLYRPHDPGAAVGRAVARHRAVDGRPPREDGRGPPEQGQLRAVRRCPHAPGPSSSYRVSQRTLRDRGCVTAPPKRGCPSHQGHDAAGALGGLRELTERSRLLSYKYLGRLTAYARATMVLRRLCYLRAPIHKKDTRTRLNT